MKIKGFTLVELLAVIVILGIIGLITTPIIINSLNSSKEKACQKQKEEIEQAAERWGIDNVVSIKNNALTSISLDTLKSEGYLKSETLKNPKDKTKTLSGSVTITFSNNQYKYTYYLDCTS